MCIFNRISCRDQKGAAVVEFAIVLPLLLLLIFGMIEFSLLVYNKHIITNASREGARYGILMTVDAPRHSEADIRNVVTSWAAQHLVTFGSDVLQGSDIEVRSCEEGLNCSTSASWQSNMTTSNFGDKLRVRVSYRYDFLLFPSITRLPLIVSGDNPPDFLNISAETVMNYE